MKTIKIWVFGFALTLGCFISHGQISRGGLPSFVDSALSSLECVVQMPEFSLPANSYAPNAGIKHKTLRFAQSFKVDFNPSNSGSWSTLANGRKVWRLNIKSEGAKSLNVIFSKYRLPMGARLFVFDKNRKRIRGSFTYLNNKTSGILPVLPVPGDQLIVEYQAPLAGSSNFELEVGLVNHDYIGILDYKSGGVGVFGSSGYCELDVNCNAESETFKRGIVKIITGGVEFSTGALINNVEEDGKPYVLSAGHSYNAVGFDASSSLFIFNYEVPLCATKNIEGTREHSVAGGIMRAMSPKGNREDIDFSLVEMTVKPPDYYRPYYLGWDLSLKLESNLTCIHHPMGDVKKLSVFNGTLGYKWLKIDGVKDFYPDGHYLVDRWSLGTTEGGSSGAPLITSNGYILGGLSAGLATCANPIQDYYFRMDKAWNVYAESSKHLKTWLDPNNTGLLKTPPFEPATSIEIKRYTNVARTNLITELSLHGEGSGMLTGHNSYQHKAYAEKFETAHRMALFGVYIIPNRMDMGLSSDVQLTIWEGQDVPERLVYQQNLKVEEWVRFQDVDSINSTKTGGYAAKQVYADRENFILFNDTVVVDGNYFVGYEINYDTPLDTFSVYAASESAKNNTAYFKDEEGWKSFTQHPQLADSYSLWIDPVGRVDTFDKTNTLQEQVALFEFYPNPVRNQWVQISLKSELSVNSKVELFSLDGKLVFQKALSDTEKQNVKLPNLGVGVYVITISNAGNSQSKLMVIE